MNDNHIEIKEQRKDWLLKGILTLILMTAAMFITLLPLLSTFAMAHSVYFYSIGGTAFVALTAVFVFLLYKECNPGIYMILNAHGFIDRKNVGDDIEIEWTNVASVKILGKTDTPFLGISLENSDIVIARMRKNEADEMTENVNENLPAILIAQNEIRIPLKELKDLLTKFVREARVLEKDIPKKPKNNPFSTNDVLRAFGKLPKDNDESENNNEMTETADNDFNVKNLDEETNDTNAIETNDVKVIDEYKDTNSSLIGTDEPSKDYTTETTIASDDDPFYTALQKIATENIGTTETSQNNDVNDNSLDESNNSSQNEDIPVEIKELLSKAKSSKISELGKMLNETDKPFTYSSESKIKNENSTDENNEEVSIEDISDIEENIFSLVNTSEKDADISTETIEETSENNTNILANEDTSAIDIHNDKENEDYVEIDNESAAEIENTQNSFDENTSIVDEQNPLSFEITLDSMIENALKSEEEKNKEEQLVPHLEVPKIEFPASDNISEDDEDESKKAKSKKKITFILQEKKD